MTIHGCPSECDLLGYLDEALGPSETRLVDEHLQGCERCRRALESIALTLPAEIVDALANATTVRSGSRIDRPTSPEGFDGEEAATTTLDPELRERSTVAWQFVEAPGDEVFPYLRDYELLKRIGKGGMGLVYAGRKRDAVIEHGVAVKMILAAHFPSIAAVEDFHREMRSLEKVQHPNIVPILDCGESDDGRPFYVMPHARGSLADDLAIEGRLEPSKAAETIHTVAKAVEYLHDMGIVHRDLKPRNILIDDSGRLWVADFGLAAMLAHAVSQEFQSRPGEGTTQYMSPEQAEGRELESLEAGRRSDIWSLGVILFELLTGRHPFQGESRAVLRYEILHDEPPTPRQLRREIPRDLQRIVLKCLEKSPEDRYQSASELIEDLDNFFRKEPLRHTPPESRWEHLERWARRKPALATRLGVAVGCSAIMWSHAIAFGEAPRPSGGAWVERFPHLDGWELRTLNQALLLAWVLGSWTFQRLSDRAEGTGRARRRWLAIDILVLSSLIQINDGLMSPLPVAFAVLIGASGLWSHVPTVVSTTVASIAAYLALIGLDLYLTPGPSGPPHKYHQYFLLSLAVLGTIMAYQVRRVQALNRLYERRPRL